MLITQGKTKRRAHLVIPGVTDTNKNNESKSQGPLQKGYHRSRDVLTFPKKSLLKFFYIYYFGKKRMQSNRCVIRNTSHLKTLPEKTSISRKSDVLGSLML